MEKRDLYVFACKHCGKQTIIWDGDKIPSECGGCQGGQFEISVISWGRTQPLVYQDLMKVRSNPDFGYFSSGSY